MRGPLPDERWHDRARGDLGSSDSTGQSSSPSGVQRRDRIEVSRACFLDAADREQRRIGKEMHDHLCQQILGAAFAVKALAGDLGREGSRHAEQLHELARMVNETVAQVRDIHGPFIRSNSSPGNCRPQFKVSRIG